MSDDRRPARPRLFVELDPDSPDLALLDARTASHLRALRLDVGSEIAAIVGPGRERLATVIALEKRATKLRLGDELPASGADPRSGLALAIAIADLGRMDLVIEKATELGATAVWPFVAERSQVRDLSASRIERWSRIGRAACEQCGRTVPPEISTALPFAELEARVARSRALVFDPGAAEAPPPSLGETRDLLVVVGPEGGLTAAETSALVRHGAIRCSLGPRILRFETAAIAALVWIAAARARSG